MVYFYDYYCNYIRAFWISSRILYDGNSYAICRSRRNSCRAVKGTENELCHWLFSWLSKLKLIWPRENEQERKIREKTKTQFNALKLIQAVFIFFFSFRRVWLDCVSYTQTSTNAHIPCHILVDCNILEARIHTALSQTTTQWPPNKLSIYVLMHNHNNMQSTNTHKKSCCTKNLL